MPDYPFDWVDAFTTDTFGGNGCVVVHGADGITPDDRMALVRETSLSECAFLVTSDKADFGARYYLAEKEILMAGHPTIATVTSLVDRGMVPFVGDRAAITLEVGAGVLPVEILRQDGQVLIAMTQPAPEFGQSFDPEEIASIFGLDAADIIGRPQITSTGTPFIITVLRDKAALRRAVLDVTALSALNDRIGGRFMEPFLVTLGGETAAGDTFSRLLLPPPMPAEDPFTGSATGCMGAYLWHHGLIDSPCFVAEQGHWMGRPGTAQVEALGPRGKPTGIRVGGEGKIIMRGTLTLD